jgi:RNA recognition motif-containing protein
MMLENFFARESDWLTHGTEWLRAHRRMPQGSHFRRRYYVDEVPGLAIFVRELPLDITADKLGGAFAAFGPVRHVNLKTQKGKDSFAFVTFESTEAASAAIERPPVIGGVQA